MSVIDNTKRVSQTQLGTSVGSSALYTAAGNGEMVKEIILTNVTSGNPTVTVWVCPSGTSVSGLTATSPYAIVSGKSMPSNDLMVLALATDLAPGDFIHAISNTATAVNMCVTNYQK